MKKIKTAEFNQLFKTVALRSLRIHIRSRLPKKLFKSSGEVFKEAQKIENFIKHIKHIYRENDLKLRQNSKAIKN